MRTLYLSPEKPVCRSRSNSLNQAWNNGWFKNGKGVCEGCIFPSCLFNFYTQSTPCSMLGQMSHKLNQDCQKKYQQLQIYRWYHSNGRKWRGAKEPLDEGEKGEGKAGLKLSIQKTKIMASSPITSWQTDGVKVEAVRDFIFGGLQNYYGQWLQPWN